MADFLIRKSLRCDDNFARDDSGLIDEGEDGLSRSARTWRIHGVYNFDVPVGVTWNTNTKSLLTGHDTFASGGFFGFKTTGSSGAINSSP